MKPWFFLSASATFLLGAAAVTDEPSLVEVLKNLKSGKGIEDLGRDGVLRSLNPAYDTVIDYVQLSERQIAQYLEGLGKQPTAYAGVDGRDVMSYAQLWAVPDDVVAREPIVTTSETKIPRKLLAHDKRAECVSHICDEEADCYEYNCARCIRVTECVGGPTSCLSSKTCHFNR